MPDADKVLMGTMEINSAKRLKEEMAERGVAIELGHDKETCTRGCRVTVEVWAQPADVPTVQKFLGEEHAKLLEDLEFDPEQASQVFDPSKGTAVCPACGTKFSTELKECPECGLAFGL